MDAISAIGGALLSLMGTFLLVVWAIALHATSNIQKQSTTVGCALWFIGVGSLGCLSLAYSLLS